MSLLEAFGLTQEEFQWQQLAACKNTAGVFENEDGEKVLFDPAFDSYEEDEPPYPVRKAMDQMCLSCSVRQVCRDYGEANKESGVWGGVYLTNGKVDRTRNEHKTPEIWALIEEAYVGV